ncbi:uncharacterized protein BXZ73DRAFT_54977 [Epithele typhae]|uniref:uncharacterized protein n=1 Tax=Epithele typhae TaxID=378194 RepID=UPI002008331C|nr:uncharacterized protein BXZ73DRAFT_54977 [Epithele typhae]KAH9914378.1 hypothetical protein BXZ73DRAFT_54977 [Epithele typhae]
MADYNTVFQNGWYIGNNLNAILYGIYLSLYYLTIRFTLNGRRRPHKNGRSDRLFIVLSTFLLTMITAWLIVQAIFGQEMWVVNENYPGGTAQYFQDHAAVWYETFGSAASVAINAATDAFLVYRLYVVWGLSKWIIVIPSLFYVASVVLGIVTCVVSGLPNANFFAGLASEIALAYSGVSMGLNVFCTVLICARIFWISRRMKATLGHGVSRTYTGAASIVVESMLPYTVFAVAYLVTLGLESPLAIFFLTPYVMFSVLSPQMIMLRVLMGRGLSAETTMGTATGTALRYGGVTGASGTTAQDTDGTDHTAINLSNLSKSTFTQTKASDIV